MLNLKWQWAIGKPCEFGEQLKSEPSSMSQLRFSPPRVVGSYFLLNPLSRCNYHGTGS